MEIKPHILFVDLNRTRVLELRRTLRPLLRKWEIIYTFTAEEALNILSEFDIDLVVATQDIMRGEEHLFQYVQQEYPNSLRALVADDENPAPRHIILLSSQSIDTPSNTQALQRLVTKSRTLQQESNQKALKHAISLVETLPSLPSLYKKLRLEMGESTASMRELTMYIKQDAAMCNKILQISNSGFFGRGYQESSIEKILKRMGLLVLSDFILIAHLFNLYAEGGCAGIQVDTMWNQNIQVATLACYIAQEQGVPRSMIDASYIAGLLFNIGRLIIASHFQEQYRKVLLVEEKGIMIDWQAEQSIFGMTHPEVSAHLVRLWGFSNPVVNAVKNYYQPKADPDVDSFNPTTALHAATSLINNTTRGVRNTLDLDYLRRLRLDQRFPLWRRFRDEILTEKRRGI